MCIALIYIHMTQWYNYEPKKLIAWRVGRMVRQTQSVENGQTDTEWGEWSDRHRAWYRVSHNSSYVLRTKYNNDIYSLYRETQLLQAVVFTTDCPLYLYFILSDSNTAEMSIFLHEATFYQIKNTKKKCNIIF